MAGLPFGTAINAQARVLQLLYMYSQCGLLPKDNSRWHSLIPLSRCNRDNEWVYDRRPTATTPFLCSPYERMAKLLAAASAAVACCCSKASMAEICRSPSHERDWLLGDQSGVVRAQSMVRPLLLLLERRRGVRSIRPNDNNR